MSPSLPGVPDALADLGWSAFAPSWTGDPQLVPARVVSQQRGMHDVAHASGTVRAMLRGALLDDPPLVGDWVAVRLLGDDQALIDHRLPRRTLIHRRRVGSGDPQGIAANVDRVGIVTAPDDVNLRRLERYAAVAAGAGCEARVVVTKIDALDDPSVLDGLDGALQVSAATGLGLDALRSWIGTGTVCFLGSSGVGKSTLVNALVGHDVRATGAVRASDGRGRHTTTTRDLLRLPGGGCVIDTPGMREIGLSGDADPDDAFPELAALASRCAYRDCGHVHEPGCAVLAAVQDGSLDPARLVSWAKLVREQRWEQRKEDHRARRAESKAFGKLQRRVQEHKRRDRDR